MNLPQTNLPAPTQPRADADDINLLNLVDIVIDNRWLIAVVTAVAIVIGGLYAYLSTPIFEANTLIQVESSKGSSGLGEAGELFNTQSPTAAEMEILRSRLVLGQVVKNLQLDLSVSPKYAPFYGRWLASRSTQPSEPGFLGMSGYVSGAEAIKLTEFEVSPGLEGQQFSVTLTAQGYTLQSAAGQVIAQGLIGQTLKADLQGQKISLLLASAIGKPGAEFYIARGSRLAITQGLQGALTITELGRASGVMQVSLEGADPVRTARVLNEVGALFTRQNVERKSAEAEKTLAFLDTQLPVLRRQLEDSENKFNQFRNQNGVFELGTEAQGVLGRFVALQGSLLDLQQKRKELDARFTAEHPAIQTIDAQIKTLKAELATLGGKSKTFPNLEQNLLRLTRDVKVNSELYTGLLNNYQQLRLVKEGKVGNVRVVDVAAVPERPIKPRRNMILATAALLGLAAGLALALARNSLRPGIKDPADIEQHAGLHVFATVPHSEAQVLQAGNVKAKTPGTHLLAVLAPQDPAVESLRSLRTALQFAMLDAPNNIVLITGPTPGIGKSFTSANFAAVLGAANKRVLLIDADLRKGHLNQYFGLPRAKGLSEVIAGGLTLHDALHQQVAPMVDFLSTGTLPPNPAEVLMAPATQALLQQLSSLYDLVIIDTPPVLAASDTAILAPLAGAVFMVARADVTSLSELQESAKRLGQSGVPTRGVIFNDLNLSKRRYGYGMGYKYGRYRYTNYQY
ncbi:polysaccharide biosynthesis tyrosine autokinase [Rhodoferax sp.]|uniref:polysaccharide biosynthesis tyrosine autokinase n=1 Tax=Rhodoferax sp. TaxID=50421 RepID=UPI0027375E95|nr:polysaccharide biosynthesis tyrosine autokinase [Rhodoferax sp.]MDP3190352.1 polysaccharide biosynthesis tyrosine autokinase [Rhodoferax sp.]MDP3335421.1 polysaccharide biosynthesis tyrosine autokinase [Rhodoferax sp.]